MSTREKASMILDRLTEEQLWAFVTLFGASIEIPEEEPDEWDQALIKDSQVDNAESMEMDDFVKELGFTPDDLRI